MYYHCLRCGKKKELRKGKKTGNNYGKYLGIETGMTESKVFQLSRTTDQRRPCLPCLSELSTWLKIKARCLIFLPITSTYLLGRAILPPFPLD
jgi:hypothetical protein